MLKKSSKFFTLRVDLIKKDGKEEITRVVSPGTVPLQLNIGTPKTITIILLKF